MAVNVNVVSLPQAQTFMNKSLWPALVTPNLTPQVA